MAAERLGWAVMVSSVLAGGVTWGWRGCFGGEEVRVLSPWVLVSPQPGPHLGPGVTPGLGVPCVQCSPPPPCGPVAILKLLSPKPGVSTQGS